MLTDIFAERYKGVPLWNAYGESERRLLTQVYLLLSEQLIPYYDHEWKELPYAQGKWKFLHKQLGMELGRENLGSLGYWAANKQWYSYNILMQCKTFLCAEFDGTVSADRFLKERLSFAELAFRDKEDLVKAANARFPMDLENAKLKDKGAVSLLNKMLPGAADVQNLNDSLNATFKSNVEEFNERLRRAGTKLNYHNGFIQISEDPLVEAQIEQPFWALVTDPKWVNVDKDMKEAIDLRDSGGRDPAFYAAKALESTIKIISGERGWTTGTERGAANFINNLTSKANGRFIEVWEGDALIRFFSDVRNDLGHGPGDKTMPELSVHQTSWAIEFCMCWIKTLVRRM